ncbi:yprA, partial [Symbiodinium microadriaticum]
RKLERRLFTGDLLCVIATNALELGIDIGDLDLTLHVGVPPTVASVWQQAGRAGRRGRPSTAILIAMDAPLEQHFCRHPDDFFALCRPELLIKNGQANAIIWCTYSVGG